MIFAVLVVIPFTANADEKAIAETGAIGGETGDCTWTFENNRLTVSGNGAMEKYNTDDIPWMGLKIKEIVIEDGVTNISAGSFMGLMDLVSVSTGDDVKTVGASAFYNCPFLTGLTLGSSVETIEHNAFDQCLSLTKVDIPDSVKTIGSGAFISCTSLTDVTLGSSLTTIGQYAFADCGELKSIVIPDSVTEIGNDAFYDCRCMNSINIPASVTSIGKNAVGYYYNSQTGKAEKISGFTIYGHSGTQAETYAFENGFIFMTPDGQATEPPTEPPTLPDTYREIFGDIDGDGDISVVDATFLQRYAADIETPYPIGDPIA